MQTAEDGETGGRPALENGVTGGDGELVEGSGMAGEGVGTRSGSERFRGRKYDGMRVRKIKCSE